MTLEILERDLTSARKSSDRGRITALSNMIDAVRKASMTKKGRLEITEKLVSEALISHQGIVQEQYDSCPDTPEYAERKNQYHNELEIVKEYAPQLLTDYEEVKKAVINSLSQYGPVEIITASKGTIMKILASELRGKADMKVVNKVVGDMKS